MRARPRHCRARLALLAIIAMVVACAGGDEEDTQPAAASNQEAGAATGDGGLGEGNEQITTADAGREADSSSTALPAPCLPRAFLDSMSEPFSCDAKAIVEATLADLPFDCHAQGIGWHPATQRFVSSCMDVDGPSARLLAFPAIANDSGRWLANDVVAVTVDPDTRHPSAFQIAPSGAFPIAMARGSDTGPTEIRFFRLMAGGQIAGPFGAFRHESSHVGAMAYATLSPAGLAPRTVLVGCGWDCATLSTWTAAGAEATEDFSLVQHGPTSALVLPGVDENVGKYNSIFLAERCEDKKPLLVASHDDWMDVWLMSDAFSPAIRIQKIAKRQISEDVVRHGGRAIFYEGMTLEIANGKVSVWAAPHDYGTESCPAGTRCAQYVYRCRFGS